MPALRLPTSFQWLNAAAEELGLDFDTFRRRCDLIALEHALDRARSTPEYRDERSRLAIATATVIIWFTARPPFDPARRSLTSFTADLFAAMNGYELKLRKPHRALISDGRLPSANSTVTSPRRLAAALAPRLQELSATEAIGVRRAADARLGPQEAARPYVLVSQPSTLVDDHGRAVLSKAADEIRATCETDLRDFLDGAEECVPQADTILGPIGFHAPAIEHPFDEPHESCMRNLPLLLGADLLIILGYGGGSHTTGFEHAMLASTTPVLYIAWGDEELPNAIAGGLGSQKIEIKRVGRDGNPGRIALDFLKRRWQDLVRSWHVGQVRQLRYGELAARIKTRLDGIPPERLERLLGRWNYSSLALELVKTPDGIAVSGLECTEMICGALGISANLGSGQGQRMELSGVQLDALFQYMAEYDVPAEEGSELRHAAEFELQLGRHRWSLGSIRDWAEFHLRLREERR